MLRNRFTTLRAVAVAAVALALGVGTLTAPASAATNNRGLYGAPNEYASVTLQSQAILGLISNGIVPSKSAVSWLAKQQCANGSFQAYRADTTVPCPASDPVNFSGPTVDQTAWALMALEASGQQAAADKATRWLQNNTSKDANGLTGFSSYPGGTPDANSTGLAYAALVGNGASKSVTNPLRRFLGSLVTSCDVPRGGASLYQSAVPGANNAASAQSFFGLTATLPTYTVSDLRANPRCGKDAVNKLGSYLSGQIATDQVLTYYPYDGDDFGNTALTVVGFTSAGIGKGAVATATTGLKANARAWALKDGKPNAGALGLLLMVSEATGSNAKKFGGVNLISELQKSETK